MNHDPPSPQPGLWERWETVGSFSIFSITRLSPPPPPNCLTKQTVAERSRTQCGGVEDSLLKSKSKSKNKSKDFPNK